MCFNCRGIISNFAEKTKRPFVVFSKTSCTGQGDKATTVDYICDGRRFIPEDGHEILPRVCQIRIPDPTILIPPPKLADYF